MGLGCACQETIGLGYFRGLGQDPTDPASSTDTGNADTQAVYGVDQYVSGYNAGQADILNQLPATGTTAAVNNNTALANVEANLAAMWTKIAGNLIAPQTTIQTPSGLQIQTPAAQTGNLASFFGGGANLLSGSSLSSISPYVPLILVGVAGLFALKALSGR